MKETKFLLLTFDIEKFVLPDEKGIDCNQEEIFEISKKGLFKIIDVLERNNIKATFFVTYDFAKRYQLLIKRLVNQSYEIALHGYKHDEDYKKDKSHKLLKKAKIYLEKTFDINVRGLRTPRLQKIDQNVLKDIGVDYTSRLHPTYVPGRYFNFFSSRKPSLIDGIYEIPISVTPLLRLPFTWFWFRNLGLRYSKTCTRLNLINTDYTNIYFHSWEFSDLKFFKGKLNFLLLRKTGKSLSEMLDKYIKYCKRIGLKPITLSDYLNKNV